MAGSVRVAGWHGAHVGVKIAPTTLQLSFTGELEGVKATTTETGLNAYLRLRVMAESLDTESLMAGEVTTDALMTFAEVLDGVLRVTTAWNVTDTKGKAVPPTQDGSEALGMRFQLMYCIGWLEAMAVQVNRQAAVSAVIEGDLPMVVSE